MRPARRFEFETPELHQTRVVLRAERIYVFKHIISNNQFSFLAYGALNKNKEKLRIVFNVIDEG